MASRDYPSLAALIEAAASGDEQALPVLRKRLTPTLQRSAEVYLLELGCLRTSHRDEVVEDALANIFKYLPQLRSHYALSRYGRITIRRGAFRGHRECHRFTSLESLRPESDDESGEETIPTEPAELYPASEANFQRMLLDEVLRFAAKIHEHFPPMLVMKYRCLRWRKIAKEMGYSEGNARKCYSRWMKKLPRKVLGDEGLRKLLLDEEKRKVERKKKKKKSDAE